MIYWSYKDSLKEVDITVSKFTIKRCVHEWKGGGGGVTNHYLHSRAGRPGETLPENISKSLQSSRNKQIFRQILCLKKVITSTWPALGKNCERSIQKINLYLSVRENLTLSHWLSVFESPYETLPALFFLDCDSRVPIIQFGKQQWFLPAWMVTPWVMD